MKYIRRLICWIFGCNSICLSRERFGDDEQGGEITGWQCERCDTRRHEQWDD